MVATVATYQSPDSKERWEGATNSGMVGYDDDSLPPGEYVRENKQQLERLIKHSDFLLALLAHHVSGIL